MALSLSRLVPELLNVAAKLRDGVTLTPEEEKLAAKTRKQDVSDAIESLRPELTALGWQDPRA